MPAGIEPDEAGIGVELEGPDRAPRGEEAQRGDHAQPQPGEARVDREARRRRLDGVLEPDVEHPLVPVEIDVGRQRRAGDVGPGLLPGFERPVERQRDAGRDEPRRGERRLVLVELDRIGDP
jgi:hypothetical protein